MGMKQILVMMAAAVLVGCGAPSSRIAGKYVVYQGGKAAPGVATFTKDGRVFGGTLAGEQGTWEWKGENIHIQDKEGNVATLKVSGANSLIGISVINEGVLIPIEENEQPVFKKGSSVEIEAHENAYHDNALDKAVQSKLKKSKDQIFDGDYVKISEIYLDRENLTKIPRHIERLTNLTRLTLSENHLTSVKGLENLTNLTNLSLEENHLISVERLENLTQLKSLDLNDNQLTNVKGLEKLTKLEYLGLAQNQLRDIKGLEKLKNLKTLDIKNNPSRFKVQIDALQKALPKCEIRHNTILTEKESEQLINEIIEEYSNRIENGRYKDYGEIEITKRFGPSFRFWPYRLTSLKGLEVFSGAKALKLHGNFLTDVKELQNLTKLEFLSLDKNQLTVLTGLEKLTKLQELTLSGNPNLPYSEIARIQKALPNCHILHTATGGEADFNEYLRLSAGVRRYDKKGMLTQSDLDKVKYLRVRPSVTLNPAQLETLLRCPNLSDLVMLGGTVNQERLLKRAKLPVGLVKLTQLKSLDLRYNSLTSVEELGQLTQLEELSLDKNPLRNTAGLENLTRLRRLSLYDTPLTISQIVELQKALPKCRISSNPTK
jgi:Leucine-rich repeat (LRR) protein